MSEQQYDNLDPETDRLIHDAEHAEAGAEFARYMHDRTGSAKHLSAAQNLDAKARTLRAQATERMQEQAKGVVDAS